MAVDVPTTNEVLRWPVVVDLATAGRCFGMGRSMSYDAVRANTFPVKVLRVGCRYRVTRQALLTALGIPDAVAPDPTNAEPRLDHTQPGS